MSSVDIAVACVLLALATMIFVFGVRPEASDDAPHRTKLDQLMERRDAIYENLRDLRFEHRAGIFRSGLRRDQAVARNRGRTRPVRHGYIDRPRSDSGHAPGRLRKGTALMNLRRCALLIPSSLFLLLLASPALAGTVTGTVRNGTTGKPAAGVEMILIQLQGTMQPVANTTTDADGHYKFDNPGLGAGPMLIRAVYRGVNYHEPATPDKTTVDVEVFEPTDKPSAFAVTVHAIIFQPTGSDLTITEEYNISNKTSPPLAYYRGAVFDRAAENEKEST